MNEHTLNKLENELVIHHPIFESVFEDILRVVQYGRHDIVIPVLGPTGSGKTTLIRFLAGYLVEQQQSGWRSDHMPPLIVEAPSAEDGKFPWRAFMENILLALGEVSLDFKADMDEALKRKRNGEKASSKSRPTIGQLEKMIRDRMEAFRPVAFFVDEVQNIVEDLPDPSIRSNLNRLKYWANNFRTKIITFGTHESKYLLNINEQLARRVSPIYFPRYKNDEEGLAGFAQFYKSLIVDLEINIDPKVRDDFKYIYNHSLGCPGILGGWFHEAIGLCLSRGTNRISRSVLNKCRMTYDRLKTAEIAIQEFEAFYESTQIEFDPTLISLSQNIDLDFDKKPSRSNPIHKKGCGPGAKIPRRYPVGKA